MANSTPSQTPQTGSPEEFMTAASFKVYAKSKGVEITAKHELIVLGDEWWRREGDVWYRRGGEA